ncbi:unnamed protein product [Trifolium pratense]|uniref:Uncharacterized protein n=1 Tax=Trifolium pratense TaxID=57577 RepID=A0ACB0KLU9_TRIPR|nr:unnamed protein product [Trifolium pratense]
MKYVESVGMGVPPDELKTNIDEPDSVNVVEHVIVQPNVVELVIAQPNVVEPGDDVVEPNDDEHKVDTGKYL